MNTSDPSDQNSMRLAESAMAHQALVRWQISRIVNDANVVDDLAQEVFFAWFEVCRSESDISAEKPIESVKSWLLSVARNKAIDWLRKNSRQAAISTFAFRTFDEAAFGDPSLADNATEDAQDAQFRLESLRHCLSLLQPEHREIVDEFYSRGKSSELIGVRLGKRSSSVRMMLTRIRRALAKCIEKQLARGQ